MKNINERIKQLRKQKGFTQESMAERLHIARSTYSKLESGNTKLDHDRLINISKILDVPISEIDDPVLKSISDELSLMLSQTNEQLSEKLYRVIPFENLTSKHFELLRQKNFDNKDAYEDTPLGGRIYKFGPRNVFGFMIENCGMEVLFQRNLILDDYWIYRWKEYLKSKEKIKMFFDENGKFNIEDNNDIEYDDKDYFLVYMILLKFTGNKEQCVQYAERDFPEGVNEWEALEYLKNKTGALDGEILCFSIDGYDPVTEIIK